MKALLTLLLLITLPFATAHDPPRPRDSCQQHSHTSPGQYHDYLAPGAYEIGVVADGNLGWCPSALLSPDHAACDTLASEPALSHAYDAICVYPFAPGTYDGEYDYGFGTAFLAFDERALECHGTVEHHGRDIHAQAWPSGDGPAIIIASDAGADSSQTCGDGILEPCVTAPSPSNAIFPLNIVIDLALGEAHQVHRMLCNPADCVQKGAATVPGPTVVNATCAAGWDGGYWVFLDVAQHPESAATLTGHIWTAKLGDNVPPATVRLDKVDAIARAG